MRFSMLTSSISEQPRSYPVSDCHSGAFSCGHDERVIIGREPDGTVHGLGVVALGSSCSWVHGSNNSDKDKSLTTDTYATRISHMEANRFAHITNGWDLGEAFATEVAIWYDRGRDIGPLIEDYHQRKTQLS